MGRQKSQQTSRKPAGLDIGRSRPGTLFIVGTPIGSPDDLTLRARTILGQVSIVAAETPLATRTLLDHHGIAATITGYQGDEEKIAVLLARLDAGHDIALVSDSGMPVIYDPGRLLIAAARAAGHSVTVVPGPSALTAAAALSGFNADCLVFVGRLPRSGRQLDKLFSRFIHAPATVVMFALPSALPRALERIGRLLPHSTVMLAVNMTKADERLYQGKPGEVRRSARSIDKDSEVTLVLSVVRKER